MALDSVQRELLTRSLASMMRAARASHIADQDVGEWLLSLGGRWLHAHGVSRANIHAWLELELGQPLPVPLVAAAATKNDFGGGRR